MAKLQWNKEFALEQTAGDQELLDELLILFKDSSESDFKQLQEAAASKKVETMTAAAHSIKGAAASLGIEGITAVALAIEKAAKANELEGVDDQIAQLGQLLTEFSALI
ncbi:MAG: histidine phosphotransferase [Desulfobulbus propionicus]|nr:MAG: histidine phosphotransferase [Desulfobulbus propionicus]PIE63590.1 MAG: histidine phosphotransferase [Desulfobacterales bacterium]